MFTNRTRTVYLITISIILNTVLFLIGYYLNLPLWLDTTGTIYISYLLGFPAGFLVAIFNSIFQAIFFYGKDSLAFYFVSGATAFTTSLILKKNKDRKLLKWLILMACLIVISGSVAVVITFLANDMIPANTISFNLYFKLLAYGINNVLSSIIAVMAVKIPDIVVSVICCLIAVFFTPKRLRSAKIAIIIDEND